MRITQRKILWCKTVVVQFAFLANHGGFSYEFYFFVRVKGALSLDMTFFKGEDCYWLGENWVKPIRTSDKGRCRPSISSLTLAGTSRPM